MNVRELRQQLEGLPDDFPVLFSTDTEGNSFNEVAEVEVSYYRIEGERRHGPDYQVLHPDDVDEDDEDQALVLWP